MSFQGLCAAGKRFLITVIFFLITFASSFGQGVRVAAAANLQSVIEALKVDFKKKTGITIEPIVGSSGKLVAQIKNGAPFDVFLSADMDFPEALYNGGFASKAPVAYAFGKLVICSKQNIGFANWERQLLAPVVKKIVIANPDVAPYGAAAQEALQTQGILNDLQSKLVFGESVAQVNTYITTGVVDVGFTSQALINDPLNKAKLYWQPIDPKLYTPIEQGMVLLKRAKKNASAIKFYNYLQSADAKKIFTKYGYK